MAAISKVEWACVPEQAPKQSPLETGSIRDLENHGDRRAAFVPRQRDAAVIANVSLSNLAIELCTDLRIIQSVTSGCLLTLNSWLLDRIGTKAMYLHVSSRSSSPARRAGRRGRRR